MTSNRKRQAERKKNTRLTGVEVPYAKFANIMNSREQRKRLKTLPKVKKNIEKSNELNSTMKQNGTATLVVVDEAAMISTENVRVSSAVPQTVRAGMQKYSHPPHREATDVKHTVFSSIVEFFKNLF